MSWRCTSQYVQSRLTPPKWPTTFNLNLAWYRHHD